MEIDKQAHKMIIAYVIAKFEEEEGLEPLNWRRLIEGGIFEFFHRIILTDIKPPVYHQLIKQSGEKLNTWVLEKLKNRVDAVQGGFYENFQRYLLDDTFCKREKKILRASHYLATNWEFKIIYNLNRNIYGVEETKNKIENELEVHSSLVGVQKLAPGENIYNFIDLVGQLRFQKRWAHSPRVPETSVLGHMLIVAVLAYLLSLELSACDKRASNNFYTGLFHDLPEVLTRDIISPIKRAVEGLDNLIKEIELKQVEERILPLLPQGWHREIRYYVLDEFKSKIIAEEKVKTIQADEINKHYNEDRFSPVDGEIIKGCDDFAAYIEAFLSISHGISSHHLRDALTSLYAKYENKIIGGVDFGQLFDYFSLPS
ncbi:MAG TPA: HD domain-containing protein [Firmicutes bacterium]|nr:HD domain-containing protein [Bacillota bacterium]